MSKHHARIRRFTVAVAVLFSASPMLLADDKPKESPSLPITKTLRGHVVFLAEALNRLHGIKSVPEARDRILALETDDGQLHPIVEDVRGRAFRVDERLRKMHVELLVQQHQGSPLAQIVRVYELTEDGKFEIDYWCEICAIAMFELKECDCCQGPIELRRQRVTGK